MKIQPISLLTPSETLLADRLRSVSNEYKASGRIIYKTHPSTFIDPNWLRGAPEELRNALFTGIILFSLVSGPKRSTLILAIIDAATPQANSVAEILSRFAIDVLVTDIPDGFTPIEKFVRGILGSEKRAARSKLVTNISERWLLNITDLSLGRTLPTRFKKEALRYGLESRIANFCATNKKRFNVFHEVALASFLCLDNFSKHKLSIDYEYGLRSRLDLLVTGPASDYTPLLAIEFDGPHHSTTSGRAKDSKKEKILRHAKVPLLRVCFNDSPSDGNVIDLSLRRIEVIKERFLIRLISRLCESMYRKQIEEPSRIINGYLSKVSDFIEVTEEADRKINQTIRLPDHHIDRLYKRAIDNFSDNRRQVLDELELEDFIAMEEIKTALDPLSRRIFKKKKANLGGFVFSSDFDGGHFCEASLSEDGVIRSVRTPAVHFRGMGTKNLPFDKILNEELQIMLIDLVAKKIAG